MEVSHLLGAYEVRILVDSSSIEIFVNKGEYVMTAQLFPNAPYTDLTFENLGREAIQLKDFEISGVEGIW